MNNVQNIDLSFSETEKKKTKFKLPKWTKWAVIGFIGLISLAVISSLAGNGSGTDSPSARKTTPTPADSITPTVVEESSEIEIIRMKWIETKKALEENDYDNQLLDLPEVKLEFELDE